MRVGKWSLRIVAAMLITLMTVPSIVVAQEDTTEAAADDPNGSQPPTQKRIPSQMRIPSQLSDGRPIRTIGLYQSQMDELIPDHFLPISLDRLVQGLSRLAPQSIDDQQSRLSGAVYWIDIRDDVLVSRRSEIDLQSDSKSVIHRSLGQVNLAIEQPDNRGSTDGSGILPRLENDPNGNLIAVFGGDTKTQSKIRFKWRLRGTVAGTGYHFAMQLPRTPQTRIVLSVPSDTEIEALDGVLRSRSGPPPDADTFVSGVQKRWYELDAGGLNRVRIRTFPGKPAVDKRPLIVRSKSVQYLADATGMKWNCRMRIQAPQDATFPPLLLRHTTVTNIRVNSFDVPFTSVAQGSHRKIQIEAPEGILESDSDLILFSVSGTSSLGPDDGWFELPMPLWSGNVTYASVIDRIQLVIPESVRISKWDLPPDWNLQTPQTIDDGSVVLAASGPPRQPPLPSAPERSTAVTDLAWSRVRFDRRPIMNSSETALRLELADGSLTARARIAVKTEPDGLAPFQIRVEPQWNIDSIAFVHSARVIENPRIPVNGRVLALWPEPEDIDRGEISLELIGSRLIEQDANRLTVPATWFVAPHQVPGDRVTAIIRPPDLNWSSNAFIQNEQIIPSELSASAARFLGALPPETLLFQPKFGRSPAVSLITPIASFDATTDFYLLRDRDELLEHLEIEIESSGKRVQQIAVQTGSSQERPPFVWSLGNRDKSPLIRLPASAITVGQGPQDGLYTINLTDQSLRGHRLIGRRSYKCDVDQTISLPTVPGATTARSHAWIGPGLTLSKRPPEIHAILFDPDQQMDNSMVGMGRLSGEIDLSGSVGLRYEQSLFPVLTVSKSDEEKQVAIVRREQIRIVASSRGIDRIEATYLLSPSAKPVRIDFEPNLQLVSVSRNDSVIELQSPQQQHVTIPPRSESETVHLIWNRDQYENLWLRKCRVPDISISGVILKSEYELIPASDAFAPAALLYGLPSSGQSFSSIELQSGDTVTLMRRNVVLATGWLIAMLVFAASWLVARRTPLVLASICIVVVVILFLWWPWKIAVIGWLLAPMVAAGMLATSRAASSDELKSGSATKIVKPKSNDQHDSESSDFSVETVFRLMPWFMLIVNLAGSTVAAQEANSDQSRSDSNSTLQSVDILVPVGQDGEQIGSIVYIPESIHHQIQRPERMVTRSEVSFLSAHYRLRIDGATSDRAKQDQRIVEAEYLIHVSDQRQSTDTVRLPLASSSVRRIELLGEKNRLIRFSADTPDSIVASLPSGSLFRLRVTLMPQASQTNAWNRLRLSIPKISASQLSVESDQDIDALRVGGAERVVIPETELRHWVESIGPRDQLVIEYRVDNQRKKQTDKVLKRRYLVDAGRRAVVIDCQLDPPTTMTAGDSFQFVIRDDRQPVITSPHWDLEKIDLLGPKRRKVTVTCTHNDPGPVRLNWTLPNENQLGRLSEPYVITIPEVVAVGSTETSAAWIALQCDPALQFSPLVGDDIEPLSVDHFAAAWTGHRVILDRAYVVVSKFPSPVVQTKPQTESTVTQEHHLHVTRNGLELRFHATIVPKSSGKDLYTLKYPRLLQLRELIINGTSQPLRLIDNAEFSEIPLNDPLDAESIEVRVTAILPLDEKSQFSLPHLTISPATVNSDKYLVSRDPAVAIQIGDEVWDESVALPNDTAVAWLKQGWAPSMFREWISDDRTYRVETFRGDFDCQQRVSIDRSGGTWSMEANIHFDSDRMPDVVDIEAPSRWCDSIEVEGALQWMQFDVSDSSRQIIRIRYDKLSVAKRSLVIRGRLREDDSTTLSVPSVQVLGPGRRQVYIDIPNRSPDGEPIQWQTSAVEASPLPPRWIRSKPASKSDRSTFVVANPSWSIELATMPKTNANPVAFLFDGQVFSQPDGALVHCRWYLFPGSLDSVSVRIPEGTTVLAAWSAGRAVDTRPLDVHRASSSTTNRLIGIPLSVSRLPQSVELLLQVSSGSAKGGDYIPKLIGIPVTRNWLVHHVPKYQSAMNGPAQSALLSRISQNRSLSKLVHERQISIASSIVDSIESTDRVSGRSQQEITTLLQFWLPRYQRVRRQAQPAGTTKQIQSQWHDLETRLTQFFERRGTDPNDLLLVKQAERSPMDPTEDVDSDGSDFSGFEIDRITKLNSTDQPPSIQPASSGDRGLKSLIFNGLAIILVCGVLICLIPVYRFIAPSTAHPAFWLALMGILGFAVAPISVAVAMVLLAIALPVIPARFR